VKPREAFPLLSVLYSVNGENLGLEIGLPITVSCFVSPVDMPLSSFNSFYEEYSSSPNASFFKIDDFIANPGHEQSSLSDVMSKFGALLSDVLNLNTTAYPKTNDICKINAVGHFCYMDEEKEDLAYLPVIVQLESFKQAPEQLRIAFRAGGSGETILALYSLMKMFLE